MKKYPKIRRLGHDENAGILAGQGRLVVQEKLDGANFRFMLDRHLDPEHQTDDRDLVFGSRNVVYKNETDTDSNFDHAIEHVREHVSIDALEAAEDRWDSPLVFFGEAMHPHTLEYDWEAVPSFLGFDVYAVAEGEFLPWGATKGLFGDIGLDTVPVIHWGAASEFRDSGLYDDGDIEVPESVYRDGVAEGIVFTNEAAGQRAKFRSQAFKERHRGSDPTQDDGEVDSDAVALANEFATEARIRKWIHKYEDRDRTIEMAVMEDLWRDVFDDIIEEEYDTIFLGNHTIDTKRFRSEVASNTATVLEAYLRRPDGSVLNQVPAGDADA